MENSGVGVGEGRSAEIEGSGLQSTGASQHATGAIDYIGVRHTRALTSSACE